MSSIGRTPSPSASRRARTRHLHAGQARLEDLFQRIARDPARFAPAVERALGQRATFTRRAVAPDAVAMRISRALIPARPFQRMVSTILGIPHPGALRNDPIRLARPVSGSTTTEETR